MIDAEKMIAWVRAFEVYRKNEIYSHMRRDAAPALVAATMAITEHVSLGRAVEVALGTHAALQAIADETSDAELDALLRDAVKRAAVIAAEVIARTVTARKAVEEAAPPAAPVFDRDDYQRMIGRTSREPPAAPVFDAAPLLPHEHPAQDCAVCGLPIEGGEVIAHRDHDGTMMLIHPRCVAAPVGVEPSAPTFDADGLLEKRSGRVEDGSEIPF